tara:strand:+ start:333 stop:521 length:189 start_codon:yes stop_codon:yes gene_type:complete
MKEMTSVNQKTFLPEHEISRDTSDFNESRRLIKKASASDYEDRRYGEMLRDLKEIIGNIPIS